MDGDLTGYALRIGKAGLDDIVLTFGQVEEVENAIGKKSKGT